jgi:hypothetical protein
MNVVATIVIIGLIVFIGLVFWTQSKRSKLSSGDQKTIKKHWNSVMAELSSNPTGAIMEADKILDEALKIKGYHGTLGDKLKKAGPLFTNQNNVWSAHKLRNQLAHELNRKANAGEAKRALQHFRQALKDLGFKL